jgi:hypothetical protein
VKYTTTITPRLNKIQFKMFHFDMRSEFILENTAICIMLKKGKNCWGCGRNLHDLMRKVEKLIHFHSIYDDDRLDSSMYVQTSSAVSNLTWNSFFYYWYFMRTNSNSCMTICTRKKSIYIALQTDFRLLHTMLRVFFLHSLFNFLLLLFIHSRLILNPIQVKLQFKRKRRKKRI